MKSLLFLNCAVLALMSELLVGAQYVVTVTQVEVVTVTWSNSEPGTASTGLVVEAAEHSSDEVMNGGDSALNAEDSLADGEYHINAESELATGRIHAHQTKTNLSSLLASKTSLTGSETVAASTGTASTSSAASLKVSVAVGLLAFLVMAAAA